jgi:hypothetical protein
MDPEYADELTRGTTSPRFVTLPEHDWPTGAFAYW